MKQDEYYFYNWLRTKDRLDRGIRIISNLKKSFLSKQQVEEELFLAAVAIDCSMDLLRIKNTAANKSVRHALRNWMINHHTFESLHISETDRQQFSLVKRELICKQHGDSNILDSCSYSKYCVNEDEKTMNKLFLKAFQQMWCKAEKVLHARCQDNLTVVAEPKMYNGTADNASKNRSLKISQSKTETKCCKNIDFKQFRVKPEDKSYIASISKPLTAGEYGVSNFTFQRYLEFGIQYLVQLEKQVKRNEAENIATEKKEREMEAKRAHEKWVSLKGEIEAERMKVNAESQKRMKEKLDAQHNRNMEQDRIFGTGKVKGRIAHRQEVDVEKSKPREPRFWAVESSTEEDVMILHWSTEDDDIHSFRLSAYTKGGTSPIQEWDDPERDGEAFKFQISVVLQPGSNYWFGLCSVSSDGYSPQVRIEVISKLAKPIVPILCKSSAHSVKLQLQNSTVKSLKKHQRVGGKVIELPPTNEGPTTFVVESCVDEEKEKWNQIWKGNIPLANIGGLLESSSYKLRVQTSNGDLSSAYGDAGIFHTILNVPAAPRVAKGGDSIGTDYIKICWNSPVTWGNTRQREQNVSTEPGLLSIMKYFATFDKNSEGKIQMKDVANLLMSLNASFPTDRQLQSLLLETIEREYGEGVSFNDFEKLWSTHIVSILSLTEEKDITKEKGESGHLLNVMIAYCGVDCSTMVKQLRPNRIYNFTIQHITLRNASNISSRSMFCTLPEAPAGLHVIHAGSNYLILKVEGLSSKLHLEMREKGETKIKERWGKSIYIGKKKVIKVTSLRQNKAYEFRCCFANRDGAHGAYFHRTIATAETPFLLDYSTIASLFTIDCSGVIGGIVEGDLILFVEKFRPMADNDGNRNPLFSCERTIVARVDSCNEEEDGKIRLEVEWTSNSDIIIGSIIERKIFDLTKHEILRMPWTEEENRIAYSRLN